MNYQIIFNEYDKDFKRVVSWIDTNIFETEERAFEHAAEMCRIWWNEGRESISYTIYFKSLKWEAK